MNFNDRPTALVTGFAGFIGFHLTRRLISEGFFVIGIDNLNDYYDRKLKLDRLSQLVVNYSEGMRQSESHDGKLKCFFRDICDSNIWTELKNHKVDYVVHLAAQAGVRYSLQNPDDYISSNIVGFHNVIKFCDQVGIKKFIYASSSSVYGVRETFPYKETDYCNIPESLYAATKLSNELMAHAYFKTKDISSVGLRFFTVYGPWGRPDMAPMIFANAAATNKNINVYNFGNQFRDFTYIDDIVNGIYLTFKKLYSTELFGAHYLNIGRGKPVSLMDFIQCIEKTFGTTLIKNYIESQPGDVMFTYADISQLKILTGYCPTIDIEEGVRNLRSWYFDYYIDRNF